MEIALGKFALGNLKANNERLKGQCKANKKRILYYLEIVETESKKESGKYRGLDNL